MILVAIVSPMLYAAPGHAEDIFSDIGRSVKRGAHQAGRAIEHGAHEAGSAIKKGVHKVGHVFHPS
jgi:hypothetical protein